MATLDVAVVGAGPVGALLGARLGRLGLHAEVFEARAAAAADDRRTLALSHASRELIEEVGAWPADATPIASIHVSQRGGPGRTLLDASEQGLPALGYTVGYSALAQRLAEGLARAGIALRQGEALETIALRTDAASLRFATGREVEARLLVLADGGANAAKIPGIAFAEKDYGQYAVLAQLGIDRAHEGRAYERFTPQGPMALLPVRSRFALVWTATDAESTRLLSLPDAQFLEELQRAFGDRAGRFTSVEARTRFPLRLRVVNSPVALRTAIVGNAAQALHPIAGQGLNLGLRDASRLAAAVAEAGRDGVGEPAMLRAYGASRQRDAARGVAFTDLLVSTFADGRRLPTWARGAALAAMDLLPPARRWLARRMIEGAPAP